MSRSTARPEGEDAPPWKEPKKTKEPEAQVTSPIEYAGMKGKTICVSSKEREPLEQVLPALSGSILLFSSWSPNTEMIDRCSRVGDKKSITMIKIQTIVQVQIILKRPGIKGNYDWIVLDRIDEIDNKKNKKEKGAVRSAMLSIVPSMMGDANFLITTMMGDQGLYERVDLHQVV